MEIDVRQLQPFADKILTLYKQALQNKGIDASGTLSQTASSTIEIDGTKLIISLNLEPYWKYVEYGRRAGKMPPIDAIARWITIKPIVPNPINGRVPDTRQLAFLIARKIGREGIEGRKPITEMVYSDTVETMLNDIKSAIVGQLKEQLLNEA
jgi:hypothetical protein